ncbi:hypothetical protein CYMTET_49826 [Cymbomonas tetramitiformis]|uniref:Uncharacterized protein n=1 Tax=Cymbomonas tetramitiformis TaxID=36881 RepID=A0AAE0ETS1_9CHLO|nr:hypothetical protein CYMTET_49826 [Cymbomonas tetramitiformis]
MSRVAHLAICLCLWYTIRVDAALWDLQAYSQCSLVTLEGIGISGATYDPESNTLWVIRDNGKDLEEISAADGRRLASVQLEGFEDTEALTWMGNGKVAVAEESGRISTVDTTLASTAGTVFDRIEDMTLTDNNGIEGLAYDAENELLYVVQEKDPMRILRGDGTGVWTEVIDPELLLVDDLSGAYFAASTGNLFLLSDVSSRFSTHMHIHMHIPLAPLDLEEKFRCVSAGFKSGSACRGAARRGADRTEPHKHSLACFL